MNMRDRLGHIGFCILIALITLVTVFTLFTATSTQRQINRIDDALAATIAQVDSLRVAVGLLYARQQVLYNRYNEHMRGHGIRLLPEEGGFRAD